MFAQVDPNFMIKKFLLVKHTSYLTNHTICIDFTHFIFFSFNAKCFQLTTKLQHIPFFVNDNLFCFFKPSSQGSKNIEQGNIFKLC